MYRNTDKDNKSSVNEIIDICCGIDNPQTMRKFLNEIFTPAEIQDVALRWRLMTLLSEGVPQREIAKELGISLCKITRGSKVLKTRGSVSKKLLDMKNGVKNAYRKPLKQYSRP